MLLPFVFLREAALPEKDGAQGLSKASALVVYCSGASLLGRAGKFGIGTARSSMVAARPKGNEEVEPKPPCSETGLSASIPSPYPALGPLEGGELGRALEQVDDRGLSVSAGGS